MCKWRVFHLFRENTAKQLNMQRLRSGMIRPIVLRTERLPRRLRAKDKLNPQKPHGSGQQSFNQSTCQAIWLCYTAYTNEMKMPRTISMPCGWRVDWSNRVELIPYVWLNAAVEEFARCIAALTACFVLVLPCKTCPIAHPSIREKILHYQMPGLNS